MIGNKSKVTYAFFLAVLAVFAMVTASYAWLGISRLPSVTDLSLTVISQTGLLIAPDNEGTPGQWDNYLDLSAVFDNMEPLRPVTYSSGEDTFYKVEYGEDGRPGGLSPDSSGYLLEYDFWMKSEGEATVYLASPTVTPEGKKGAGTYLIGCPVWNRDTISHDNGGRGAETMVRMGFRITPVDEEGREIGASQFFVYEPNADIHVDGSTGYKETPSAWGASGLVDSEHMIIQRASTFQERTPVLMDTVIYQLGEFTSNPVLHEFKANDMVKFNMYVWMEGQDSDCVNAGLSNETEIAANIQFGVAESSKRHGGDVITPR